MRLIFKSLLHVITTILATGLLNAAEVPVDGGEQPVQTGEQGTSQISFATVREARRERLVQLNSEQRYDEAAAVALAILQLTRSEFGENARQLVDPLTDLAEAQQNSGELASAELNLSAAVMLIEKHDGLLSTELIEPLTTLGRIYNQSGVYDKAKQTLNRALRLNHVNHGFTNFDQFPIMDGLTETHTLLKDYEEARFYQESQLEVQQRRLGVENPETTAAYFKLARWYSDSNLYEEAILAYQKADRIVRKALGDDSPQRVEGLEGLALLYQKTGNGSLANSVLRRALKLLEESPDSDPISRASVMIALGDSLTRGGKFNRAREQYTAAWHTLPDDDTGAERRKFYFDKPIRLEGNLFPNYARGARARSADTLKTGSILVNFSVDDQGRVRDASVIESDPEGLVDQSFLSIYRRSLFRPRYVDGLAEHSGSLLARHEFLYAADELTTDDDSDSRAKSESDDIGKSGRKGGKLSYPEDD